MINGTQLAKMFHEIYEKLAPNFGYETRETTKEFNETTPNGKLMIATCSRILEMIRAENIPLDGLVMQKIARENRYTFTGESITGYWIIRDKKDNNDATIFIDCPKEYVPKIVETLNSNFSA